MAFHLGGSRLNSESKPSARLPTIALARGLLVAQKRNLDAHVRQDSWVEPVKRDSHFHGLLSDGPPSNDRPHVRRNLPIGIGVQCGGHLLMRLDGAI